MSVIVKICGLTRPKDAAQATAAGADWLGINFWPQSKRYVGQRAADVVAAARAARADAVIVGVFVNQPLGEVRELAARHSLDRIQLHGDETAADLAALGPSSFKAVGVASLADLAVAMRYPGDVLLLDTKSAGYGGSGETFDWSLAKAAAAQRQVVVAGGLHPGNVAEAITATGCFGVDVASGVESAPGDKDHDAVTRFIDSARAAARSDHGSLR